MGKKAPRAPDPVATAQAQGAINTDTARLQARLNRNDTVTPWGSVTNRDMGNDQWETRVNLSPNQQRIADQGEALDIRTGQLALDAIPRAQRILSTDVDTAGLAPWQAALPDRAGEISRGVADRTNALQTGVADRTGALQMGTADRTGGLQVDIGNRAGELARGVDTSRFGSPDISRDRVETALLSRLEPQFARDREAMEGRLIAQGFVPGSEAYNRATDELGRARNDARFGAVLAGGQEQSRLFGLGLQDANFRNASTQQAADFDLRQGGFRNDAVRAAAQMDLARMQAGNAAVGQATEMDLARMQAGNAATGQATEMDLARMQAGNAATGQAAAMDQARAGFGNNVRQMQLAEQLQLRAQPVNEIAALFGLGPGMQTPQAMQVAGVGVNAPDMMGMVSNNYNARMQGYGANMGAFGQGLGALGAAGGGWARGGFVNPFG